MKIVQFLRDAGSWGGISPSIMNEKGLGGRETALVQLSENWAKEGHEVINFVPIENPDVYDYGVGKSYYCPTQDCVAHIRNFGADVFISWEEAGVGDVPDIVDNVGLLVIEMQVAHLHTDEETDSRTDYYAVLSNWAGDFIKDQHPYIDEDKFVVFKNCIDHRRYESSPEPRQESREFFYSSSPDRGLVNVLRAWPKIRERYSNAKLHVMYGVEHWLEAYKWSHNVQGSIALEIEDGLKLPGVVYHGKVGQDELAKIQKKCVAQLYPCETFSPTETGCISVVEASAAGAIPFITNEDCLGTEFCDILPHVKLPFNQEEYLDLIFEVLEDDTLYELYRKNAIALAKTRRWDTESAKWIKFFEQKLYGDETIKFDKTLELAGQVE